MGAHCLVSLTLVCFRLLNHECSVIPPFEALCVLATSTLRPPDPSLDFQMLIAGVETAPVTPHA